jgi:hypothetical protein
MKFLEKVLLNTNAADAYALLKDELIASLGEDATDLENEISKEILRRP